jgi:hypothetical protein
MGLKFSKVAGTLYKSWKFNKASPYYEYSVFIFLANWMILVLVTHGEANQLSWNMAWKNNKI